MRPCHDLHFDPSLWPSTKCRLCELYSTRDEYRMLWIDPDPEYPRPSIRSLPCIHEEGIHTFCPRGDELLHVRGCALDHPNVTRGGKCFAGCADYAPSQSIAFHLSCNGIGDTVVGFYAACGLADSGHPVDYHAKQSGWLTHASHPGVRVIPWEHDTGIDANANYGGQLRAAADGSCRSRAQWYCDRIADAAGIPRFTPVRPKNVRKPEAVIRPGYVLIAPYSHGNNRQLPLDRWRDFVRMMATDGNRVVACGSSNDATRLSDDFRHSPVEWHFGHPPEWTAALIAHADSFVGIDSGLTHVAGLMGTPATAVVSQVPPAFLFDCAPSIAGETPDKAAWPCVGCGFQYDRGYRVNCDHACDALASLGIERIGVTAITAGQTLVSADRLAVIRDLVRETNGLPGELAEVGVYRGGTAKLIAHYAQPGAALHLFDTFAGIPEDDAAEGGHAAGEFAADADSVRLFLANPNAVFHIGEFPDSARDCDATRFRFVHIDADIYQSTAAALDWFSPRMVPGGIIVLDDFEWKNCPGVAKAMRERFDEDRIEIRAEHQAFVRFP